MLLPVALRAWVGISKHLYLSVDEVHDPVLGNAACGISLSLAGTVVGEAGVGNFYDEEHLVRPGMCPFIVIRVGLADGEVWLGFAPVVQYDRVLQSH